MAATPRVRFDFTVSPEMDEAMRQVALATGESKRSFARRAVLNALAEAGVVDAAAVERIGVTATAGPIATRPRKPIKKEQSR